MTALATSSSFVLGAGLFFTAFVLILLPFLRRRRRRLRSDPVPAQVPAAPAEDELGVEQRLLLEHLLRGDEATTSLIDTGIEINFRADEAIEIAFADFEDVAAGDTALGLACSHASPALVQALLAAGADVNLADEGSMRTSLHRAAARGSLAVVEALLAAGAAPWSVDQVGALPLHEAAGGGHLEIVDALLESGGFTDTEDADGETPLSYALLNEHSEIADRLRQHGAR